MPTNDEASTVRTTTVVVPVREFGDDTRAAVERIARESGDADVVVLVWGNEDAVPRWLADHSQIGTVVADPNASLAGACDTAAETRPGDTVVVLRPTANVPRRWLDGLLAPLRANASVGATGPLSDGASGPQRFEESLASQRSEFRRQAEDWRRAHDGLTHPTEVLSGPCIAVRHSALTDAGGFSPEGRGGDDWESMLADVSRRLREHGAQMVVADEVVVRDGSGSTARQARRSGDQPLISACIIARDEEEDLPGCLASLRGFVDEIVVCDTGSEDKTVAIARAAGARVVEFEWCDDFAAARNAALDACSGTWVLQIDADEQLVCDDADAVRTQLARRSLDALQLPIRSFHSDVLDEGLTVENWYERLFRRDKFRYFGRLHERLELLSGGTPSVKRTRSVSFLHGGYRPSVVAERGKHERNLRIAEAAYAEGGDDRWHLAYVLGRCLSSVDRHDEAAERYREALETMPAGRQDYRVQTLCCLAAGAIETGADVEAETCARDALNASPGNGQARYLLGAALNRLGRHEEARSVLRRLLEGELSEKGMVVDHSTQAFFGPIEMGVALLGLGNDEGAATHLLDAAEHDPQGFNRWPELVTALRSARPDAWVGVVAGLANRAPRQVAETALAVEDEDTAAALELWKAVPDSRIAALGRSRCHAALSQIDEAVAAVNGIDIDGLPATDLIFIATLAVMAGDRDTAMALLGQVDVSDAALAAEMEKVAAVLAG